MNAISPHIVRLASGMYLDKLGSLQERNAANRNIREFLLGKAREWFPDKLKVIPQEVLFELIDNFAAGIMEIASPGKNKILDQDLLVEHVDKTTGDRDRGLEGKLLTLFEGSLRGIPGAKGLSPDERVMLSKQITGALLGKSRKEAPKGTQLVDEKGKLKASLLEHLLYQNFQGSVDVMDAGTVAKELAGYLSTIPADSSYVTDLTKLLGGVIATQSTMTHYDFLNTMGTSKELYKTLEELINLSWYGPVTIPVDLTKLDHTLTRSQANTLLQRINSIDHSKIYKDKERLLGGVGRLPPYPGPREPWNKGNEVLLSRDPGTANFDIREGLHRFMAMMVAADQAKQPKFSVSAYVYDRGAISKLKKNFMDLARSVALALPSSSKGLGNLAKSLSL